MAASPRQRSTRPANTRRTTPRQRKQQHMLDVAVRVDSAARQRKRWFLGTLSKCIVAAGMIAGLYYGGTLAVTRLLFKNPDYNVTELNVETDGVLTPAAVIEASDLRRGVNIFPGGPGTRESAGRSASASGAGAGQPEPAAHDQHPDHRAQADCLDRS